MLVFFLISKHENMSLQKRKLMPNFCIPPVKTLGPHVAPPSPNYKVVAPPLKSSSMTNATLSESVCYWRRVLDTESNAQVKYHHCMHVVPVRSSYACYFDGVTYSASEPIGAPFSSL